MKNNIQHVLGQIETERDLQDDQWGGQTHDDTHFPVDWTTQIAHHLEAANREIADYPKFRKRLLKIAALAVAGIQSQDRLRFDQLNCENSQFKDWFKQVREAGIFYNLYGADSVVSEEVWKVNFDNGETPLEAILEDLSQM
ncbi:MAG TPA: hypothetical protein PKY82_25415 [Pyrinomonadaceae bacterium]|nr:hypothetical protein [Pyrinomonadaceae bacterium]